MQSFHYIRYSLLLLFLLICSIVESQTYQFATSDFKSNKKIYNITVNTSLKKIDVVSENTSVFNATYICAKVFDGGIAFSFTHGIEPSLTVNQDERFFCIKHTVIGFYNFDKMFITTVPINQDEYEKTYLSLMDQLNNNNFDEEEMETSEKLIERQVESQIDYLYEYPNDQQISEWCEKYKTICLKYIDSLKGGGFNIPRGMISNHPCLVYLILTCRSITKDKKEQMWFDLYASLSKEKINKLYAILYREKYLLLQISKKNN